jgi:peptide-methionine (S)-S-oxide reductase
MRVRPLNFRCDHYFHVVAILKHEGRATMIELRKNIANIIVVATLMTGGIGVAGSVPAGEKAHPVPAPEVNEPSTQKPEVAILAGGCFWGVQGVFQHVKGVTSAVSGYTGGERSTAHYSMVGSGSTGHAESVRVIFDPQTISYGRILQIYFSVAHDPTELNRQGPDVGSQYRSAIFPTSPKQAQIAEAYIDQLNRAHAFNAPIVTKIEPDRTFYPAEGYHQDFLARNPSYAYIAINDVPKIESLKRLFPEFYPKPPRPGCRRALKLTGGGWYLPTTGAKCVSC